MKAVNKIAKDKHPEKKKQKLAPGEVETVKIPAEMIEGIESGTLRLSLEEV